MADADELDKVNEVGGVITGYLTEIVKTDTTEKFNDDQYGTPLSRTVLELTAVDRLGPKIARTLYQGHEIESLQQLCTPLQTGTLAAVKGFGPKMQATVLALCEGD